MGFYINELLTRSLQASKMLYKTTSKMLHYKQGLGLAIGATLMDLKRATTLGSVTVMTFMLAGGYFVKVRPQFL